MKKAVAVQYVTDDKGRKTSVILPVDTYEEMLEDIQDLVAVAERRSDEKLSLVEMKKRLKKMASFNISSRTSVTKDFKRLDPARCEPDHVSDRGATERTLSILGQKARRF